MSYIKFLTAGISPRLNIKPSSKNQTADALPEIKKNNLDGMEIEFVRNVYLKKSSFEKIQEIKNNAINNNLTLTIHAPYFINLNAKEDYKIENSKRYILDSLEVADKVNAKIIVVHIGYFLKQDKNLVLEKILKNIKDIKQKYHGNAKLGIELTGKKNQVGSLDEIFYFYEKLPDFIRPVIDFSHQHARENGFFKNTNNIDLFFKQLNKYPVLLEDLHMHLSGINYTEKGERNHLNFIEADINYKYILKKIKEYKIKGTIVCESPDTLNDALILKKEFEKL